LVPSPPKFPKTPPTIPVTAPRRPASKSVRDLIKPVSAPNNSLTAERSPSTISLVSPVRVSVNPTTVVHKLEIVSLSPCVKPFREFCKSAEISSVIPETVEVKSLRTGDNPVKASCNPCVAVFKTSEVNPVISAGKLVRELVNWVTVPPKVFTAEVASLVTEEVKSFTPEVKSVVSFESELVKEVTAEVTVLITAQTKFRTEFNKSETAFNKSEIAEFKLPIKSEERVVMVLVRVEMTWGSLLRVVLREEVSWASAEVRSLETSEVRPVTVSVIPFTAGVRLVIDFCKSLRREFIRSEVSEVMSSGNSAMVSRSFWRSESKVDTHFDDPEVMSCPEDPEDKSPANFVSSKVKSVIALLTADIAEVKRSVTPLPELEVVPEVIETEEVPEVIETEEVPEVIEMEVVPEVEETELVIEEVIGLEVVPEEEETELVIEEVIGLEVVPVEIEEVIIPEDVGMDEVVGYFDLQEH